MGVQRVSQGEGGVRRRALPPLRTAGQDVCATGDPPPVAPPLRSSCFPDPATCPASSAPNQHLPVWSQERQARRRRSSNNTINEDSIGAGAAVATAAMINEHSAGAGAPVATVTMGPSDNALPAGLAPGCEVGAIPAGGGGFGI